MTPILSFQTKVDVNSDSLPTAIRNSEERLSKGDIYVLENGLNIFLWVGVNVQQGLIQNLFGVSSFSQISSSMVSRARRRKEMIFLFW